jgi:hypothetical protein
VANLQQSCVHFLFVIEQGCAELGPTAILLLPVKGFDEQ